MKRHDVVLKATDAFLQAEVTVFPSTIYPVFVNIIDNAIFWLKDIDREKTITLDVANDGFLISNNGPLISSRDANAIFDQGFTRKHGN